MKKIHNFSDDDFSRGDKCLPVEGKLFSGGYAMIYGLNYYHPDPKLSLEGRIVFLNCVDEDGFWDCYDKNGDILIIMDENLMPVSDQGMDNGSNEINIFNYQARFGS